MTLNPLLRKQPPRPLQIQVIDSDLPRFGNSVYFKTTDHHPNVRFNNMIKMINSQAYWVITGWFENKVTSEEYEFELILNSLMYYSETPPVISHAIGGMLKFYGEGLDSSDLSGKDWVIDVLVRRLTVKEINELKTYGMVFLPEETVKKYDMEYKTLEGLEGTYMLNPEKPNYTEALSARAFGRTPF